MTTLQATLKPARTFRVTGEPVQKTKKQHLVAEHTEGKPDTDMVTYEGNAITRAAAMAKIDAADAITRGVNFFDVQDLVDTIKSPVLKAQVRNSMAWSMDMQVINKARQLFFALWASSKPTESEDNNGVDSFNYFIGLISSAEANEQYAQELGYEENTGMMKELAILVSLRQQWHDLAETSSVAAKQKYTPKTLDELMASEKPMAVTPDMSGKFEALAKLSCGDNEDAFELAKKMLITKQEHTFRQQFDSRVKTAPAVSSIISMAEYRGAGEEASFHELPTQSQIRMIESTQATIKRTLNMLATWRGIDTIDYATSILPDGFGAIKALDAVLASPKFN